MAKTYTRINQINGTEIATTRVASHTEGIDDQPIGVVISGTQTAVTSAWTGNAPFTALEDNQIVYYYLPYSAATSTDVTLNLTLSDGTTTGAKAVYFDSGTNMKSKFKAGSIVPLIFKSSRKNSAGTTLTNTWMYVPDASSYCTPKNMAIPFFIGTGTAAKTSSPYNSARWTYNGASEITLDASGKPANGTTICVRVPVAGNGTYGTGLSLDNGTNYYPVCANVNTMVGTRYAVDASVILTFNSSKSSTLYNNSASGTSVTGIWQVADYTVTDAIGYQIRSNSASRITSDTCRYYKIFFSSADDKKWVPACADSTNSATSAKTVITTPINPFGPIVYNSSTTAFTANSTIVTANSTWQQYLLTLGYSFNRTNAALTLTLNAPVYIKCAPQANGSAIIDATTPYVQTLPNSNDGKIYIFLGLAYSTTQVELRIEHPVYYHDGTALKLWTGPVSAGGGTIDITVPSDNATYPILLGNTNVAESDVSSIQKSVGLVVNPNKKSVAEGANTTASGTYSHAEGYQSQSLGSSSHSEGAYTNALQDNTHAEGRGFSFSLGTVTTVISPTQYTLSGITVTIEGSTYTLKIGDIVNYGSNYAKVTAISGNIITINQTLSADEGNTISLVKGVSYGARAHSEGYLTAATENQAHAEGYLSMASGNSAHAEGVGTRATGAYSHAEGSSTASGNSAHAEGVGTTASGNSSHAEGYTSDGGTIEASNYGAHAGGCAENGTIQATSSGAYARGHAEDGGIIQATSGGSHAEGYVSGESNVTASLTNSIAYGSVYGNNSRVYSHGETSVAIGNVDAHNASIEALGDGACAIGCIEGDENGGTIKADGKGTYAGGYVPEYGGIIEATSDGAHAEGYVENGGTIKADGKGAHAEGCNTNASGLASHAEGIGTMPSKPLNNITGGLKNNCRDSNIIVVMPKQQFIDACVDWDNLDEDVFIGATFSIPSDIPINANALPSGVSLAQFINSTLTITSCSLNSYDTEDDYFSLDNVSISFVVDGRTYQINSNTFESSSFNGNNEVDWDNPITIHINNVFPISTPNALGAASHTEGNGCQANGDYSHAEGSGTYTDTTGVAAHAEGAYTKANNSYSHAEGFNTIASGDESHAEGYWTIASGTASHAEGQGSSSQLSEISSRTATTITFSSSVPVNIKIGYIIRDENGAYAKVTNISSRVVTVDSNLSTTGNLYLVRGIAHGDYSHAEGYYTTASGTDSHAEGCYTRSCGAASHAEGNETIASEDYSHAEGEGTKASNECSHAEGYYATASGYASHAEGINPTASGDSSHAEGTGTTATGPGSHAEGDGAISSGQASHAEGQNTIAIGVGSHAEGAGNYSDVTIGSVVVTGVEDGNLTVNSNTGFTIGELISYQGHPAIITSKGNKPTILITQPTLGEYYNGTPTIERIQYSGPQALGNYSHAEGDSTIASGTTSHAEGDRTTASGITSHAEGWCTTASGDYSHAEGYRTMAFGNYSHAEGYGTLSQLSSISSRTATTITFSTLPIDIKIGSIIKAENGACAKVTAINTSTRVVAVGSNLSTTANLYLVRGIAYGSASHAEGISTTASGDNSHAGGNYSIAYGTNSFAFGNHVTADNGNFVIGGYNGSLSSSDLFAIGNGRTETYRYTPFKVSNDSSSTGNYRSVIVAVQGKVNASTGFYQTSDINKKNVIGDLDLDKAYELIDKCQTILYTLKDDESNKQEIGLIAQEVKEFFPELVTEDENGVLSLDYSRLTVIILKVLKDVIDRVKKLEDK